MAKKSKKPRAETAIVGLADVSAKPAEAEAAAILKARLWANKIKSRAQVKPRANRLLYHEPAFDNLGKQPIRRKRLLRRQEAPGRFDWVWPESRAEQRQIAADLKALFGDIIRIPSQAVVLKSKPILLPEAIERRKKAKKSLARWRKKFTEKLAEMDSITIEKI